MLFVTRKGRKELYDRILVRITWNYYSDGSDYHFGFSLVTGNRRIVHDIIENVNELIFIFDKDDKTCFTNLPAGNDNVQKFLLQIESGINQSGAIPADRESLYSNEKKPIIFYGELETIENG